MGSSRRLLPLLLAICLLVWCVLPATGVAANNCVDGGAARPDQGGIGGTGLQPTTPDDDDSGIGGTGISAGGDTGIIGTVTGFGSICVGGVEIHYNADTVVQVDGQPATAAQLAVGQVVEAVASGSGSEVRARQIAVRHVLSGPVTRVDAPGNEIDVMGETVQLSPVTRSADGDQDYSAVATAFPLHSSVQVSGMRRSDGIVVASRVSRVDTSDQAQVVGPVAKLEAGTLWVAGTAVRTESHTPIAIGDEVHVVGRWDGSALVSPSVELIPRVPFDGRVTRVDIEGYAGRTTKEGLQVGPFAVELPPATAQEALRLSAPDARIRIHALVQDRHVIVQGIGLMDDLPSLPALPQREVRGWNGGRPGDGRDRIGDPPPGPSGPGERDGPPGPDGKEVKPDGSGGFAGPPRREASDRPPAPQMPDRPSASKMPDRPGVPQRPDRPAVPLMPDRPGVPQLPDRPPRIERPSRPERPDVRGRP